MSQRADLATRFNSSTEGAEARPPPDPPARLRPARPTWLEGASPLDAFAAGAALLLALAISPAVASFTFTPKLAVLLVVVAVGIPQLLILAFGDERSRAAQAATAFLVIALISAATSRAVLVGFFGLYSWGTGWIFWCGVAGAWAIGRSLSPRGRELVLASLLIGGCANALFAIAQEAFRLDSPVLGLYQGTQAEGLMGNPIYLESLLLGSLAALLTFGRRRTWRWSVLAGVLAAGLELSGERFGEGLVLLLGVYTLITFRSRAGLAYAGTIAFGYGIAYASTNSLRTRLSSSVASNPRSDIWEAVLRALEHHPILGVGPGQTLVAITTYQPLVLVRRLAVSSYILDAHDIVLEIAVTTGVLGLVAFLVFCALALRRASGPLLAFAALAVAIELVEPINIAITPMVFLALGAATAAARSPADVPHTIGLRRHADALWQLPLIVIAVVLAGTMIAGDFEVNEALLHYDYSEAVRGTQLLPVWSQPATDAANVATARSNDARDPRSWLIEAAHWRAVAVSRSPIDTDLWSDLAESDSAVGDRSAARAAYAGALGLDRYNTEALIGLGGIELRAGDRSGALALFRRAVATARHFGPALKDEQQARR